MSPIGVGSEFVIVCRALSVGQKRNSRSKFKKLTAKKIKTKIVRRTIGCKKVIFKKSWPFLDWILWLSFWPLRDLTSVKRDGAPEFKG